MKEIMEKLTSMGAYAHVSIEGKGLHIGRIKGIGYDADGTPIIELDIDAVSCTGESYFDQSNVPPVQPVIACMEVAYEN